MLKLNATWLQNKDGGWGLHIEGPSTMFGTVLTYVTLRLLGQGPNDGEGAMERGRFWILDHGSATATTSWGKMWLSVQNSNLFLVLLVYLPLYYTTTTPVFKYSFLLECPR